MGSSISACFWLFLVIPGSVLRCSNVVAPRSTRYRIRETTVSDVVEDDVVERLVEVETDVAYIRVGMGELKSEIKDLRGEIRELRTELKGDIKGASKRHDLHQGADVNHAS